MAALTVADTGIRAELIAPAGVRPIDWAFREIDALGGWFDPKDREAVARDEMLRQVLAILERHGAVDPSLSPATLNLSEAA
ncbi:hypothetical protein [Methylobacterium flocculans]|uniref:hypothetical protein n=1 Tax=Methylobacterium flocculans TaxID=2984843 RepID=UPI0021F3731E|nr:hypothetical protein [Methylobacterium sp. FF17]